MTLSILITFTISAYILAISPGPDNIFVLTQSIQHGYKKALWVILGLCLGLSVQTLCVVFGVTAIILTIPALMLVLQIAGAAYLCFLAYKSIKYARCVDLSLSQDLNSNPSEQKLQVKKDNLKMLRRGFIMNITNPKVQLFFLAFFPQFLPKNLPEQEMMFSMFIMGMIMVSATILVFGAIAYFAGSLREKFQSERFNMILNYSAATIFIALAIYTVFFA